MISDNPKVRAKTLPAPIADDRRRGLIRNSLAANSEDLDSRSSARLFEKVRVLPTNNRCDVIPAQNPSDPAGPSPES